MWAVLNPGRKRRSRKAKGRKRKSYKARRRTSRSRVGVCRASSRRAFKAGFEGGMRNAGRLVRAARGRASAKRAASVAADRRYLPAHYAGNPRRRRRNPLYMPSYGYNPGKSVVGNIKQAYSLNGLKSAGVIVAGVVANGVLSGFISNLPMIPDAVKSGYGKAGIQLATAGLTAAITNMAAPRFAKPVLAGGALLSMITAIKASPFGGSIGFSGMRGMADWLRATQPQVSAPIPNPQLGDMLQPNCLDNDEEKEF